MATDCHPKSTASFRIGPRPSVPGLARLAIVASCLVGVASPAPALAQPTQAQGAGQPKRVYIVAVTADPELEAVAARIGSSARATLRTEHGVAWEAADEHFLGYDDATLAKLREARQRLADGRQAYLNLDLDHAIQLLQGAVNDFDGAAAALEDSKDLGDALLLLGASQVANGQARDARHTFERLHVQMPDRAPDPQQFNPEVVQDYQQSAPRDAQNPTSIIAIQSDPPGAIAYVDFVPRGRTPISVNGLVGGPHVVRMTRPGSTPNVQSVDLRRGRTAQINAVLSASSGMDGLGDALSNMASSDTHDMQTGGPMAKVAQLLELDEIGVIRVSHASTGDAVHLELSMFDVAHSRRLLQGGGDSPRDVASLERASQQLVTRGLQAALHPQQVTDTENIIGTGGTQEGGTEHPGGGSGTSHHGGSILTRWWFWTAVGVVVVGAIITVIAVASSSGGKTLGQDSGGQVILRF